MLPDVLSVAARALSFVCALQAAGTALFLMLFELEQTDVANTIRRRARWLAVAAAGWVLMHYALEPARMAGDLSGVWDASLQKLAATSGAGTAAALRILGLALIVFALRARSRVDGRGAGGSAPYSFASRVAALAGVLLVAGSFVATGHTAGAEHRWILGALLFVHLVVIEFWFGALVPLMLITRHAPRASAVTVRRFSRLATGLVPLILIAGLTIAWVLIPSLQVFREPYGQLLLAKAAGFAALIALAALNKWRLAPALEAGDLAAVRAFQWSAGGEYALIVIVLAVTAVMTSFFSPEA